MLLLTVTIVVPAILPALPQQCWMVLLVRVLPPPPCTTCAKVGGWETDISQPDCCICNKSADDCAPGYTWIPSHCQCGCAPQSCTGNYTWNSTTCQCECPLTATDCPHGVDTANCTCNPKDGDQECRQRNMSNYCCSEEGTGGVIPSGDNCDDAYTISWNTDLDPDACDCSAIETEEPEGCKEDNHNTHYCCSDEGVLQDDPCINPTSDYTVIWTAPTPWTVGRCVCAKKSETEQQVEGHCSGGPAVEVGECESACLDGTRDGSCRERERATYDSGCNCNSSDGTTYVNRVYNSSNCTCQCPDDKAAERTACVGDSNATWNDNRCKCTCSDPKKVWNFSARTSFSLLNKALSVFGVTPTGKCVCNNHAAECGKVMGTWDGSTCNNCSGGGAWSFDESECTGECTIEPEVCDKNTKCCLSGEEVIPADGTNYMSCTSPDYWTGVATDNSGTGCCLKCECGTTTSWGTVDLTDLYTCHCIEQTGEMEQVCTLESLRGASDPGYSAAQTACTSQGWSRSISQNVNGNRTPGSVGDCGNWVDGAVNGDNNEWQAGLEPGCIEHANGTCQKETIAKRTCTSPCSAAGLTEVKKSRSKATLCVPQEFQYTTAQEIVSSCTCQKEPTTSTCDANYSIGDTISVAKYKCEVDGGIFQTTTSGSSITCACLLAIDTALQDETDFTKGVNTQLNNHIVSDANDCGTGSDNNTRCGISGTQCCEPPSFFTREP